MKSSSKSKQILSINLNKDMEELQIRMSLSNDSMFQLEMLSAFRPGASLRQINNVRQANLWISDKN